jgi:hypothetical protein
LKGAGTRLEERNRRLDSLLARRIGTRQTEEKRTRRTGRESGGGFLKYRFEASGDETWIGDMNGDKR